VQQLHLVGFTTDLEGLIFSARKGAKSGGYLVLLDDKLRATVEDALRLRNGQLPDGEAGDGPAESSGRPRRPRPESTLSPREIQARLRSGSTIAEVAREAGVGEDWVSRFAVPIQAEQAQVVGRARRLVFVKSRLGESALPLGTAVRWNLADKGLLLFDDDYEAAWSAYNLQGASWVVRFEYTSRQKRQVAEWEVDLREGELFARNRMASELGYLDPARRRRRPPALEPSPRETPARPADQARPAVPRREEPALVAPAEARPAPQSGGGRRVVPTSGRSAMKKAAASTTRPAGEAAKARTGKAAKAATAAKVGRAAKPATAAKAAKTSKAAKAGKATTSRKASSAKRGRAQKSAAKKRGGADHIAPRAGVTSPPLPAPAPAPPDEPMRPSHLARPPSPMPTARRATTLPLHTPRPVPPRPPVEPVRRPAPPPEPEADIEAEAPPERERPTAAPEAAPSKRAGEPERPAAPTPRAATEGVRVLGRPERVNGQGPAAAARRRAMHPQSDDAAPVAAADSPERRLARRLASPPPSMTASGRSRRPPEQASSVEPEPEPVWHGPGSGEPAPTVRIRADLAAGTRRPPEPGEGAAPPRRRRERPLRAR
jgi:hypothetical protein